jgi:hypothetical protein
MWKKSIDQRRNLRNGKSLWLIRKHSLFNVGSDIIFDCEGTIPLWERIYGISLLFCPLGLPILYINIVILRWMRNSSKPAGGLLYDEVDKDTDILLHL